MNDWYQQVLTPPDVIECRIRVGIVPSQDHVQYLVELYEPTTGVLIAQWSAPHGSMHALPAGLERCRAKAAEMIDGATEPF